VAAEKTITRVLPSGAFIIYHKLPFDDERNFIMFLNQSELESLTLKCVRLRSEEVCRAVAEAEVQYLELAERPLSDGGAALVESVRDSMMMTTMMMTTNGSLRNGTSPS
jgi:hypothetical protein